MKTIDEYIKENETIIERSKRRIIQLGQLEKENNERIELNKKTLNRC